MIIRTIEESDLEIISLFEKEISKISFEAEAIIDLEFHKKKILKSIEKEKKGMLVLEKENKIIGWLWMSEKINYLTEEKYINFKSFYISEEFRGDIYTDMLLQKGIEFAKENKAQYIVGKVNINNIAMRLVYNSFGFNPTHLTMELKLGDIEQ